MSKRLFLKQMLTNPRSIGAAFPSSSRLAQQMASHVPHHFEGPLLELGPGTGVVTKALLQRNIPANRIVAIEYSEELIRLLRKKFPKVHFIHGDASHLETLLHHHLKRGQKVEVIVSSLPLKSLPQNVVKAVVQQMDSLLIPSGRIIQFTYDLRNLKGSPFPNFRKSHSKIIWQNIPPARVSLFERIPVHTHGNE